MRVPVWFVELLGRRRSREPPQDAAPKAGGDFRGPYGFGRRAHRPDPNAKYGFDPNIPRQSGAPSGK
jgi:hypothetical protein